MKDQITSLIRQALAAIPAANLPSDATKAAIELDRTRDPAHGDFASSLALRLAKAARRNPRELAQAIVAALPASDLIAKAEVAGAGFINFHLAPTAYACELERIAAEGERYGRSKLGAGNAGDRRVRVVQSRPGHCMWVTGATRLMARHCPISSRPRVSPFTASTT